MEPQRFDSLVRTLGTAASRRRAIVALLAGFGAPLLPALADAAGHGKKKGKARHQSKGKGRVSQETRKRNRGKGKGRGQEQERNTQPARAPVDCRGEGHPCEGNQRCCDGLVCAVSGPGQAERCTVCGAAGDRCCDDGRCERGFVCDAESGTCVPCGGEGDACCSDESCNTGFVCQADSGTCVPCGGDDEVCCAEGDCDRGLVCNADNGRCVLCGGDTQRCCAGERCDDGFVCDAMASACVPCGGNEQRCCRDETCQTGFVCESENGTCAPCGVGGTRCCAAETCDTGFVCTSDGSCVSCGGAQDREERCCADGSCDDGFVCNPNGFCVACGGDNERCCADETCESGFVCSGDHRCARCGGDGQSCCANQRCDGDLVCDPQNGLCGAELGECPVACFGPCGAAGLTGFCGCHSRADDHAEHLCISAIECENPGCVGGCGEGLTCIDFTPCGEGTTQLCCPPCGFDAILAGGPDLRTPIFVDDDLRVELNGEAILNDTDGVAGNVGPVLFQARSGDRLHVLATNSAPGGCVALSPLYLHRATRSGTWSIQVLDSTGTSLCHPSLPSGRFYEATYTIDAP